jgi:hypothetical protein
MPYFITDKSSNCKGWATVKRDGTVIGCHTKKQDAVDQMVAISLSEKMEPGGELPQQMTEAVRVIAQHALVEYAAGQPRDRKGRFGSTGGGGGGGGAANPDAVDKVVQDAVPGLYGKPDQLQSKGHYIATTDQEKWAAEMWVESGGYKAIQAAHSGQTTFEMHGSKEWVDEGHHFAATTLEGLTRRATLAEDMVLSRGIKEPPTGKSALVAAVEQAGVGGVIQIPKFTATTKNPMVALSFSTKQIVRITAPKGTRALDFDLIKHGLTKHSWGNENREREVLFPPGTKFKVTGVKRGAVEGSIFIDLVPMGD